MGNGIDLMLCDGANTLLAPSTGGAAGLVPASDGSTSKYLRADGTWAAVSGGPGGASATTVEVNLGSALMWRGKFTITDAAIGATSKVLCWQAPGPYTGKGTRADEAELQPVTVIAAEPGSGSAVVKWQTPPMYASTPVLKDARALDTRTSPESQFRTATRIGGVRGNVKFSYLIF